MRRYLSGFLIAGLVGLVAPAAFAGPINSMQGTYYVLSTSNPDVNHGIDGGTVTGLVTNQLGPDGLPVASAFGLSYAGPSGPITDVNATTHEILWWQAGVDGTTLQDVQTDTMPLNFPDNFFPNGQTTDSNGLLAVHWQGTFNIATPGSISMTLGSDDDAFVYIDGNLVDDNGGVHALTSVPITTSALAAGSHSMDVFFADRHTVQSAIEFSTNVQLTPVPEPGSLLLLGSGLLGLFGTLRRRFSL